VKKAKFLSLLKPENSLELTIETINEKSIWELRDENTLYSKGTLIHAD
jgi:hypothetical protein